MLKPKGGIIGGASKTRILHKWIEICGDLMRPEKAKAFQGFPYHALITPLWRQSWYDASRAVERDGASAEAAWATMLKDGNLLEVLPKDPRGDVHVTDTWVWGPGDRKLFFLTQIDSEDENLLPFRTYESGGTRYYGPLHKIDYTSDIGLSPGSLVDIDDPETSVHPHLNYTVDMSHVQTLGSLVPEVTP